MARRSPEIVRRMHENSVLKGDRSFEAIGPAGGFVDLEKVMKGDPEESKRLAGRDQEAKKFTAKKDALYASEKERLEKSQKQKVEDGAMAKKLLSDITEGTLDKEKE